MCQYVLVHSLIVFQVDLLHVEQLLSFFDLLPKVFALIKNEQASFTFAAIIINQRINEVSHLDLLCAIVQLKLIRELVETKKQSVIH